MDLEKDLLKLYYKFIKENSIFSDILLVVPKTPQSFSSFPTIVFKEINNLENIRATSLDRIEYMDLVNYSVDIYTKNVVLDNRKYLSDEIMRELRNLTFKFFHEIGLRRISSSRAEFIDITVDRTISIFEGKINNWNGKII